MPIYKIDLICPLYKAEDYIENLHKTLIMQKGNFELRIKYILTKAKDDKTEEILNKLYVEYLTIEPKEFSHSLTREKAGLKSDADIIVFITQDIIVKDELWLSNLTMPIIKGECEASFSRQVCNNNSIERYTRIHNYPEKSRIVSKNDIDRLGIMTFFFSDASSAISVKIYKELNGYDGKDLPTNEDMYFAYKLINKGYRIKYCADSQVIHSHEYSFWELFRRYFDQGIFLSQNNYLMKYKANDSAFKMLKVVMIESLKEYNFRVLFNIIPNFLARFLGNKFGQNYKKISLERRKKYSSNKSYWEGL